MASLQGQEIKDTYQALLKTDGNTNIDGTLQTITDGQGNASALALSTDTVFTNGTISNNVTISNSNFYLNNGGTSGSQYFLYNATNQSIYLNAWEGDYVYEITSSLVDKFPPGQQISFIHTKLGLLNGTVSSSYFYNGEGDDLTIIKLTTDPSNGVSDDYSGESYPPNIYYNQEKYSIVGGSFNVSSFNTHTEGYGSTTIGPNSHAEGIYTTAIGMVSHTEGYLTTAIGPYSHAEGIFTKPSGSYSHAEGDSTITIGRYSHAEGYLTTSIGVSSHAEGASTTSIGPSSHAEGSGTKAVGLQSHAEGSGTIASGSYSHAEGWLTTAIGFSSHAEGSGIAIGNHSHAEGGNTAAIGVGSHAEGIQTRAIGDFSHAEGVFTISSGSWNGSTGIPQHAEGRYNVVDTSSLLIVGNGTADNARANAFAVTTWGTNNVSSSVAIPFISQSLNFANDAAAAAGGVPLGCLYHNSGTIKIRLT